MSEKPNQWSLEQYATPSNPYGFVDQYGAGLTAGYDEKSGVETTTGVFGITASFGRRTDLYKSKRSRSRPFVGARRIIQRLELESHRGVYSFEPEETPPELPHPMHYTSVFLTEPIEEEPVADFSIRCSAVRDLYLHPGHRRLTATPAFNVRSYLQTVNVAFHYGVHRTHLAGQEDQPDESPLRAIQISVLPNFVRVAGTRVPLSGLKAKKHNEAIDEMTKRSVGDNLQQLDETVTKAKQYSLAFKDYISGDQSLATVMGIFSEQSGGFSKAAEIHENEVVVALQEDVDMEASDDAWSVAEADAIKFITKIRSRITEVLDTQHVLASLNQEQLEAFSRWLSLEIADPRNNLQVYNWGDNDEVVSTINRTIGTVIDDLQRRLYLLEHKIDLSLQLEADTPSREWRLLKKVDDEGIEAKYEEIAREEELPGIGFEADYQDLTIKINPAEERDMSVDHRMLTAIFGSIGYELGRLEIEGILYPVRTSTFIFPFSIDIAEYHKFAADPGMSRWMRTFGLREFACKFSEK